MCKEVTRNILWSNSSSKEILTQFAEGLACKYYDAHQSYIVRLVDKKILTWLVINKNAAEKPKPVAADVEDQVKFARCRTVTIVNGIMNCDCGRTQQFLMPCTHICAVIKKKEYMDPSFYHVRWYKTFMYYWKRKFSKDMAPNVLAALDHRFHADKRLFSSETGKYMGINVKGSQFFNNVHNEYTEIMNDDETVWMKSIKHETEYHAIPQGTITMEMAARDHKDPSSTEVMDAFQSTWFLSGKVNNDSFTDTVLHLSQQRESYELSSLESSVIGKQKSDYAKTFEYFKEAATVCRNRKQHKELQNLLQRFSYNIVAQNTKEIRENNDGMQFFGADLETRKHVPRLMNNNERLMRTKRSKKN